MWQIIDKNTTSMMPFITDTIEKWNTRNQNVQNLLHKSSNKGKVFNKGIVEQIDLIMNDKELFEKAVEKT
jgi:hypothetical protein